jgi:hypothetical protein
MKAKENGRDKEEKDTRKEGERRQGKEGRKEGEDGELVVLTTAC